MAKRTRTAYIDKDGNIVPPSKWHELRADDKYRLLTDYTNERFHVFAEWNGEIPFATDIPRSEWKPYGLEVFTFMRQDEEGRELDEPVKKRDALACQRFKTAEEAVEAAAAFLRRWAGLSDKEIMDMEPLRDEEGSKAAHIPTKEEAAAMTGDW